MEIGGGYLMWLCLREKWAWWVGALGAFALMGYGIIPTLQPAHFGRVYAAYGGVFVVMSMLWGWFLDGQRPDHWDIVGASLCIVGVIIIMYVPRGAESTGSLPMFPQHWLMHHNLRDIQLDIGIDSTV